MTFEQAFSECVQKLEALADATEQEDVFEQALAYAKIAKSCALQAKSGDVPYGGSYEPWNDLVDKINYFLRHKHV